MSATLAFGLVAACALLSAVFVVLAVDLIRAVLWLGVTLVATAALYAMLGASFLAGVQLLLYVGGVMTLMVFGVMITRRHQGIAPTATDSVHPLRGAVVASALFALVATAIVKTDGLDEAPRALPPFTLAGLGRAILVQHMLAFEALSLLLLAAIIGAVVLARRRDPESTDEPTEAAR